MLTITIFGFVLLALGVAYMLYLQEKKILLTDAKIFCIMMLFMIASLLITAPVQEESYRVEAIDAGVAHWQIDSITGEKKFIYHSCQGE